MLNFGIEKISFYPSSLKLDFNKLASHRGKDYHKVVADLMVEERSILPLWEDTVTLAINAAEPLINEVDVTSIDLLIGATETGVDQEKGINTWAHRYLNIPSNCRTFEIKSACYSATAALRTAQWYLTQPANLDKKVLVVIADLSTVAMDLPQEYVFGCGGLALLLSNNAQFLKFPENEYGIFSSEVSDIFRPLPWVEAGDSQTSLVSYIESLAECYEDYCQKNNSKELFSDFDYFVFHTPFPGISRRAFKYLARNYSDIDKSLIEDVYTDKSKKATFFASKIGGIYSGAVYSALLSLLTKEDKIKANNRLGIFSYGSGSCAEFLSATVCDNYKNAIVGDPIAEIESRFEIDVAKYEYIEKTREQLNSIGYKGYNQKQYIDEFYNEYYTKKKMLVLDYVENYVRHYKWSK